MDHHCRNSFYFILILLFLSFTFKYNFILFYFFINIAWMSNCVGYYNHKYFIMFLLYTLIGVSYGSAMSWIPFNYCTNYRQVK